MYEENYDELVIMENELIFKVTFKPINFAPTWLSWSKLLSHDLSNFLYVSSRVKVRGTSSESIKIVGVLWERSSFVPTRNPIPPLKEKNALTVNSLHLMKKSRIHQMV